MNAQVTHAANELVDTRLRAGNTIQFTVPTSSMYPYLLPGDRITVRKTETSELRFGAIIVLRVGGSPDGTGAMWLAHRLIARHVANGTAYYVTKGDNCAVADVPWTESQLCGSVIGVHRQKAAEPTSLLTWRARYVGVMLALFSRGQWCIQRAFRGSMQRIVQKPSRMLFRVWATAARWITG